MLSRDYCIAVFGATGFTGQRIVTELLKTDIDKKLGYAQQHDRFNMLQSVRCCKTVHRPFAAAGRSASRLTAALAVSDALDRFKVVANVDVSEYDSVLKLAKNCRHHRIPNILYGEPLAASAHRLIINVVGPYRLYGEAVVRACCEAATHYLDVSGEPESIERMEFKYGDKAQAAGCYVVSAAGFDSVPADLGTLLTQREFVSPAVPSSVEAYLQVRPGPAGYLINYATWHSAVLGMGAVASVRSLRQAIRAAGKAPAPKPVGPKPRNPRLLEFCHHPAIKQWTLPFPGADASVVRRTQGRMTADGEPAVHFTARFVFPTFFYCCMAVVVGALLQALARTPWGRVILLRWPGLFSYGCVSREGPSLQQIQQTTCTITCIGRGYSQGMPSSPQQQPDREVVYQITAPDPGYNATSIFVVHAALAILEESEQLPQQCGVYTPAGLLRNTSYIRRLQRAGIRIEKLSDGIIGGEAQTKKLL